MLEHSNYESKKFYLLSDPINPVTILDVKLAGVDKNHFALNLLKESWGPQLYSNDQIRGLGAAYMIQVSVSDKRIFNTFLKQFAITYLPHK